MSSSLVIPREICRDFEQSSRLEWLETNGTGAFAMGSVAGVNRRRYHGLLIAALPGQGRRMLLSRVEEEALIDGRTFALGACQYPGVVTPRGFELLEEFRAEPCATWIYNLGIYNAGGVRIEKQIYLVEGKQAVVLRYRADRGLTLRVRPFVADRDYHSLQRAATSLETSLHFRTTARFIEDAHWYYNIEYLTELERGLDFREDLYSPGHYACELAPGEWAALCASIDGAEPAAPPSNKRNPFFFRRSDGKPGIIAGFPWFTEWGRDTMISLPGLLISQDQLGRRQLNAARAILEAWIGMLKQGLIPNHFPDTGGEPEYNSADATLWMFQAVRAWLAAGGDQAFLHDVFLPAAREIVAWHSRGTMYGIGVDPRDHLLIAGGPGTQPSIQLTWMDARVDGRPVTPRHGKPVEINALWHSALRLMGEWGDSECAEEALRVRGRFRASFWNPGRGCLYDVVRDEGPDAKLRPNQIFAVSLGHSLLEAGQQQAVVRMVERELLTPAGLRTLEPGDPDYKPYYRGGPAERDGAYHEGTVWPWLLGPFIDAYLIAFGRSPEALDYCRGLLHRLEEESARGPLLGSIAEIYDGNEPRLAHGCSAQAWSAAEVARLRALLL